VRLLRTPPDSPAYNLALDEALLRSGVPTLRLYSWDPPGYSLGFFQRRAEHEVPAGFECVRRPTGGGAIAHVGELTISWIGERQRVDEVYARINATVARAMKSAWSLDARPGEESPEAAPAGLCFDAHTCYDLLVNGRKIFGSAQRRAHHRFLLHGTFVLEPNPLSEGAVSLEELVGPVPREQAETAFIAAWEGPLEPGELSAEEREQTERLIEERYGNEEWTSRR
jgi:lipoate-protein ligase A